MSVRRRRSCVAVLFALALLAPLSLSSAVRAEESPAAETENTSKEFIGRINANAVFVRSGAGDTFYPVMKLDRGAEVTVVGIKYDWLKIRPPEGSFSYVAKAYVQRRGDASGGTGRVTHTLNVRAGSTLNKMTSVIQTKLNEGEDVQIIGEHDEYFMIKPPANAFVYVNKQYVTPVRRVETEEPQVVEKPDVPTDVEGGALPAESEVADQAGTPAEDTGAESGGGTGAVAMGDPASAEGPTTRQSEGVAPEGDATQMTGATTQPSEDTGTAAAEAPSWQKLEAQFEAASAQPVTEQPLEQLTSGYTALIKKGGLTPTQRRIADARLTALKIRTEARQQFVALKESQEQARQRQQALAAEREELQERMKQTDVAVYTAVGTLRVSSLQQGDQALYRLTDPSTGRTLVYLRTNDPKYAALLNQFIGVRGDLQTDARLNLRVITPTEAEPVDPSKVNGAVAAQVIPPSMISGAPTASVGD